MKLAFALISLIPIFAAEAPSHTVGAPNAPITIELYSDFQCPGCKALHESTIEDLRRDYVNKGKVRLVYRDIHLPAHKYARLAACYAGAAEKLGIYDSVAIKLFETQRVWEENGKVDDIVASVVPAPQMMKLRALATEPALGAAIDVTTSNAIQQVHIPGTPRRASEHSDSKPLSGRVTVQAMKLVLRLGLAAVFLYAAYTKLKVSYLLFAMSIDAYQVLPSGAVLGVARALPWMELAVGIWLLIGWRLMAAALTATVILGGFFSLMAFTYGRGLAIDCGCFGLGEALTWKTLLRDGTLVVAAAVLAWTSRKKA